MTMTDPAIIASRIILLFIYWFGLSAVAIAISPVALDLAQYMVLAANLGIAFGLLTILVTERHKK